MMVNHKSFLFSVFVIIFIVTVSISCYANDEERKVHIVYMGSIPQGEYSLSSHHVNILEKVVDRSLVANSFVRSYKRSFNGFAANLNTLEAQKLAGIKEVISVFPSTTLKLHTTRSWDFLGLDGKVKRKHSGESDVIIGVIDSGIWPELESFSNQGFGPAPKKWKGVCEGGKNFTCNNKLIGARYYHSNQIGSARDDIGHGSHTASIAAGNDVNDASFYGLARGTAREGVPSARIAVYKVCHPITECNSADVLAAFDDAIADGVDIITISIGAASALNFDQDVIAIGSFHAMEKGILTTHSAGNAGCGIATVASTSPWVISVAASTIDRKIITKILLNGTTVVGDSVNAFTLNGTAFPLVYRRDVSSQCDEVYSELCMPGCVDKNKVKGKIILCGLFDGVNEAYKAGALGVIAANDIDNVSFVLPLPAVGLSNDVYLSMLNYMNYTKNPLVNILKSEAVYDSTAPTVASFSSCGPNIILDIMKPDVIAPGVNILAAYSPIASPSTGPLDRRQVKYNIVSGTSMACPHVAGVAAYVKSFHPRWSPSAVKSAIMTTARPMNTIANPSLEFSYGSGLVNPAKAITPGLVLDANEEDYIKLLCGLGLNSDELQRISGDNATCNGGSNRLFLIDFNYPAITNVVPPMVSSSFKFHRTVTNVGLSNSTYKAKITPSPNMTVSVEPNVLSFNSLHEKKSFVVTVVQQGIADEKMASTSLVWFDGIHSVRIPILVFGLNADN